MSRGHSAYSIDTTSVNTNSVYDVMVWFDIEIHIALNHVEILILKNILDLTPTLDLWAQDRANFTDRIKV